MNLLQFLCLLAKYKMSITYFRPGVVQEIKETLDGAGAVWIKFAQTLAQLDEFIGDDLAMALEPLFAQCRRHSHQYSASVVREELDDTYDVDTLRFIGSGSMAQTYVVYSVNQGKDVCVKITHPDAYREIREALATYDAIKDSVFFPRMFVNLCWMFFESLRTQLDTGVEFRNMELMCGMFQRYNVWWVGDGNDGSTPRTPMVLTPRPIAHTTNTIVMEYLPGFHVSRTNFDEVRRTHDERKLALALRCTATFIGLLCVRERLCHLDLHPGNIGFRVNSDGTWNVIVYDMGQFFDYRHMTDDVWAMGARSHSTTHLLPLLIEMTDDESHDVLREEVPDERLCEQYHGIVGKQFGDLLLGRKSLRYTEYLGIIMCSTKVMQHSLLAKSIMNSMRGEDEKTERETEYQTIVREFGDMDLDLSDWLSLFE
jgi:hypothetical protein